MNITTNNSNANLDLLPTKIIAPASVTSGGQLDVSWIVKNQSSTDLYGTWYDNLYLSEDELIDDNDILLREIFNDRFYEDYYSYSERYYYPGYYGPYSDSYTHEQSYIYEEEFLEPQKNYTATSSFDLDGVLEEITTGDYYLILDVDAENQVSNNDPSNDILITPLTITSADVDLAISDFDIPTVGVIGETIELSWTIFNQGADARHDAFSDRVYLSDDEFLDETDLQLGGFYRSLLYESEDVYIGYSYSEPRPLWGRSSLTAYDLIDLANLDGEELSTGDRYLLIVTDSQEEVTETNETNNILPVPITLIAPEDRDVDLEITSFTTPDLIEVSPYDFDYHTINSNQHLEDLEFSWTVNNSGRETTLTNWKDRIYYSQDAVWDDTDLPLSNFYRCHGYGCYYGSGENNVYYQSESVAGQDSYAGNLPSANIGNISLSEGTRLGEGYFILVTDADNELVESDESNNTFAVPVDITLKNNIISNLENFSYEGIGFYAYNTQVAESIPVYRFYEPNLGVHFYTPNEEEKIYVGEHLSNYDFEGIAYYAFEI